MAALAAMTQPRSGVVPDEVGRMIALHVAARGTLRLHGELFTNDGRAIPGYLPGYLNALIDEGFLRLRSGSTSGSAHAVVPTAAGRDLGAKLDDAYRHSVRGTCT